jgi:hypothetical protein
MSVQLEDTLIQVFLCPSLMSSEVIARSEYVSCDTCLAILG